MINKSQKWNMKKSRTPVNGVKKLMHTTTSSTNHAFTMQQHAPEGEIPFLHLETEILETTTTLTISNELSKSTG